MRSWLSSSSTRSRNSVSIRVSCSSEFCWVSALWTRWYLGDTHRPTCTRHQGCSNDQPHLSFLPRNRITEAASSTKGCLFNHISSVTSTVPVLQGMKVPVRAQFMFEMLKGAISKGIFSRINEPSVSASVVLNNDIIPSVSQLLSGRLHLHQWFPGLQQCPSLPPSNTTHPGNT